MALPNYRLSLSADEMRTLGYQAIDIVVEHLAQIHDEPAVRTTGRAALEARLREPLPERGTPPGALLERVQRDVLSSIAHPDHPRFFAYVPGPSNYIGVIGDLLASGFNTFAGTWLSGSAAVEIELITLDWLKQICGLPETAGGLFVSGGSMANLTALAVARQARLGDEFRDGVVYYSDQTHASVERALRVLGFASYQIRSLPSDEQFRLPLPALRSAVAAHRAAGKRPFCVVANAGTTNSGAVDPLPELAAFCREEGLWFHVDGAYGGAAVLCDAARPLLAGMEAADSLVLDPHKWLFQPFEIGCVLVRDADRLRDTFRIMPDYLQDVPRERQEVHPCDYGIQLTRGFRALKLWMSLKVFGLEAFRGAIRHGLRLAQFAEAELRRRPAGSRHWEIVTPAQLGVFTFRLPGDDTLTERIVAAMIAEGFAMFSSTRLRGRSVLRWCAINPRTTEEDIVATVARLGAVAEGL